MSPETRLHVALQPIVSLDSGRLVGAESVCRFPGMRPPRWPVAGGRRAGLGPALELAAASAAFDTGALLAPPTFLSVEVSPGIVSGPVLAGVLERSHLSPERIVLALSGPVAVALARGLVRALNPLRERGVRLALDASQVADDSFSQLLALRPDVIRFGRPLIAGVARDPARRAVLVATNLRALEIGAKVVAADLEKPVALETVRSVGISYGQGCLLGHPTTDQTTWRSWQLRQWSLLAPDAPPAATGRPAPRRRAAGDAAP